jgi:glycosyltransferase involved in cell wall biosynthesis
MLLDQSNCAPISVVIRNLNEGACLRKVLQALQSQDRVATEIIVVDNESTDDSLDVAREYGARIVSLPRKAFSYGRALNIGIREASQPFVLNLSAHSIPLGRTFIEDVLEPFRDPTVGAVSCRDVAKKQDVADWPTPRRLTGGVDWETLFTRGLVNSAAAIRRDLWLRIDFDEHLPFSEDALWSRKVLTAGYDIVVSTAMYAYLRDHKFLEIVRRRDSEGLATYQISGLQPSYGLKRVARAFFVTSPRAALRVIAYECLLWASTLTLSLRVRRTSRKEKPGAATPPSQEREQETRAASSEDTLRPARKELAY